MEAMKQQLLSNTAIFAHLEDWDDTLLEMQEQVARASRPCWQESDRHKTIPVANSDYGEMVDIDEEIAPLIREIWKAGIKTTNSCQNNWPQDYVWIEFACGTHLEMFLTNVFIYADMNDNKVAACRARMNHHDMPSTTRHWKIKPRVTDWEEEEDGGECDMEVSMSLRFPHEDLEILTQLITQFNHKVATTRSSSSSSSSASSPSSSDADSSSSS